MLRHLWMGQLEIGNEDGEGEEDDDELNALDVVNPPEES